MRRLVFLACLMIAGQAARAHEVRPGYLEINEGPAGSYAGRLRQPIIAADGGQMGGLDLKVVFPENCERTGESVYERSDDYLTERFSVRCNGSLAGGEIVVEGLRQSITDIYVTFTPVSGEIQNVLLNGGQPGFTPDDARSSSVLGYLGVGVGHLLGGVDHVLFVLGLVLLVPDFRRLIYVVTAFTLAHSLTLGLAVLDVVRLPSAPVEAGIALSILFLAFELTRPAGAEPSLGRRHPELVAFGFGLLHGFGFAGVLLDIGLPSAQVVPALLFFNLGVEVGQLVVVSLFGVSLYLVRRLVPGFTDGYRGAVTWALGIGASYFFTGTLVNLF